VTVLRDRSNSGEVKGEFGEASEEESAAAFHVVRAAGEVREALQEERKGNFSFEPGEWGTEAEVRAESEREVSIGLASDVEAVGLVELFGVTVGGAEHEHE